MIVGLEQWPEKNK